MYINSETSLKDDSLAVWFFWQPFHVWFLSWSCSPLSNTVIYSHTALPHFLLFNLLLVVFTSFCSPYSYTFSLTLSHSLLRPLSRFLRAIESIWLCIFFFCFLQCLLLLLTTVSGPFYPLLLCLLCCWEILCFPLFEVVLVFWIFHCPLVCFLWHCSEITARLTFV